MIATNYPRDASIHRLFEEVTAAAPGSVALELEDQRLTYGELNERANRLAHYLRRLGVGPEVPVGLRMERSVEMIVSILGILKAGGAYVPLDGSYPADRLRFIQRDAGCSVVLPDAADSSEIAYESAENLSHTVSAANLAYVMYTSGSTGRPKGVMVPHRAVVRLVRNTDYASFGPDEVFLQLAPISFDASTFEIWGALLNGARLVLMPPGTPSLEELGRAIRDHGVTTLWLTAGLFHVMVDQRLADLRPLRQLLAGGDVLSPAHVRRAREALPGCRIINGYGPTEGTTFSCCHVISEEESLNSSVPIGRPIANTTAYVLDEAMQPATEGELYIGGDGLARGYLNAPELTAERFIANPFSSEPDARLYKTGDLARRRPDGVIEFLGRADQQLKWNGFRIEPGEIEAVLGRHPAVRETIVVARRESPSEKRLAAYVVPKVRPGLSHSELRAYLQARLPGYMVPGAFVLMDALPLTLNGKVDREALPAPEAARPAFSGDLQTETETLIFGVWRNVLRLDPAGVNVNFFDLGGDSLQLIEVHSALEKLFGSLVSITDLFQFPTISSLAQRIDASARTRPFLDSIQERAGLQREASRRQRELRVAG